MKDTSVFHCPKGRIMAYRGPTHTTARPMPASGIPVVGLRPNSVNLRSQALDTLLDRLDSPIKNAPPPSRQFVRWPYRRESLEIRVVHPGGNIVTIRVACRNISRGGMCVLHNSFLHTGSECRVMLPHPTRGVVEVPGAVVRCLHRSGVIHELGIAFKGQVDVLEILQTDRFSNTYSFERVAGTELVGRVLVIEPSVADSSVLKHFLRDSSMEVQVVGSLAEAVLACDGVDVVVASSEAPDADPAAVVSTIRECRFEGPIVMVVPDASPDVRARLAGLAIQVIIVQPMTQELLMRALGEALLTEEARSAPPQSR
jgi:CheY-like chemotaxis protein